MKINRSFYPLLFCFFVSILSAQSQQIVPLANGNKWYYNCSSQTLVPPASFTYYRRTREVLRDTLITSIVWKAIRITTYYSTYVTQDYEYWRSDSSQFKNLYISTPLYNTSLTTDSTWSSMGTCSITLGEIKFGGATVKTQKYFIYDVGSSEGWTTGLNIGVTNYESGIAARFGGSGDYSQDNLVGALINGVEIGDSTLMYTSQPSKDNIALPRKLSLLQNYPNPFNPMTRIDFFLPKASYITITIFDVLGKEIAILMSERSIEGTHSIFWDASAYPSGMYFYRIQSEREVAVRKMILLK